jgi:putative MATE family efflux protein
LRKEIIQLAWPVVLELLLVSMLGVVNMIMVGHLGANAISAVGITSQPVLICFIFFQAFNVGGTALVARCIGQDDVAKARRISALTLNLNALAGVVIGALTCIFAKPLVLFMGAQPEYLADAVLYMQYSAVGVVLQALPTGVSALVRGAGNTRIPAVFNLAANIVNVVLGAALLYLPFLRMGVAGVAIAQLAAKAVALGMSLYAMFSNNTLSIRLSPRDLLRPDFSSLGRLVRVGLPAAGEQLAMRAGLLIFSKLVADLGTVPFAAHNINMNLQGIIFNFGAALGVAATSLTGRMLGACRRDLAEAYLKETRRIGLVTSVVFVAVMVAFPGPISRIFTGETDVVTASAAVLWIGACIVPFQTSQLILCGGLRGAGDTIWPLVATMCGVLFVRTILGYVFIVALGWGLAGAWAAFLLDQMTRSLVIYLRYKTGKWVEKEV